MIKVTPVPLYHNIGGKSLFDSDDPRFQEYRRRWQEQPTTFAAGEFPLFLDLEVTNLCNLRCTFCATTHFPPTVKRGLIDPEIVYRLLDEGGSHGLYGVKFNDRGEPLLHPELPSFVRYAKQQGLVDVYFNTNAMLLTPEKSAALIEAGLDRISFSVEGTSADPYERLRVRGKFDTVLANIRELRRLRDAAGSATPKIRVQSVLVPEIRDRLDDYRRFWEPIADEVSVLDYKEESDAAARLAHFAYPWACPQLWQRMTVWWDGTILPCNEDDQGRQALGNVKDMTIAQAWKDEKLEAMRRLHRQGQAHQLPACDGCYLRDSQIKRLQREETAATPRP
ncbi:radical SAM/SPASM domain-containing protein [Solidesulfovibrio sp.]